MYILEYQAKIPRECLFSLDSKLPFLNGKFVLDLRCVPFYLCALRYRGLGIYSTGIPSSARTASETHLFWIMIIVICTLLSGKWQIWWKNSLCYCVLSLILWTRKYDLINICFGFNIFDNVQCTDKHILFILFIFSFNYSSAALFLHFNSRNKDCCLNITIHGLRVFFLPWRSTTRILSHLKLGVHCTRIIALNSRFMALLRSAGVLLRFLL